MRALAARRLRSVTPGGARARASSIRVDGRPSARRARGGVARHGLPRTSRCPAVPGHARVESPRRGAGAAAREPGSTVPRGFGYTLRSCQPGSTCLNAEVAELADALASGASPGNRVGVQIPASAPAFANRSLRSPLRLASQRIRPTRRLSAVAAPTGAFTAGGPHANARCAPVVAKSALQALDRRAPRSVFRLKSPLRTTPPEGPVCRALLVAPRPAADDCQRGQRGRPQPAPWCVTTAHPRQRARCGTRLLERRRLNWTGW